MKYADLNGDGHITPDDQTWIFNPVPDLSALMWSSYDFDLLFSYSDRMSTTIIQNDFWSVTAGSNKGDRVLEASNVNASIPMLTTNNKGDEGRASSYRGKRIVCQTAQIGYNIPGNCSPDSG